MEHKPQDSTPQNKPESDQETKPFKRQWVTWEELQGISGHGQSMFISTRPMTQPNPKESKRIGKDPS